jgi:hypothetical protein
LAWFDAALRSSDQQVRYTVLPFPKELHDRDKVIWFKRSQPVPEIAPDHPFGPSPNPQGKKDPFNRVLIARSPDAVSEKQIIRQPDHPNPLPADVPAPNMVVVREQGSQPLPKPAPKEFVRPPEQTRIQKSATLVEPPPALLDKQTPSQNALGAVLIPAPKLPPKAFVLPPRATGNGSAQAAASPSDLPAAPGIDAPANSAAGAQAVILGLDPSAALPPLGSRSGQFAQAPVAGTPSSGAAAPGTTVPGLVARGRPGDASASGAPAAKTGPAVGKIVKEIPSPQVNRTVSAPLRPSSRIIPAKLEAIFAQRDVYTMAIPGPNLPDYPGDWVLWFAQRGATLVGRVSAPIPARKYVWDDPAVTLHGAAPTETLVSGTVQFFAVIDKTGHISTLNVLRGPADEAFRAKAAEEMETWEFKPALLNGTPIDVDIVLEFSMKLRVDAPPSK